MYIRVLVADSTFHGKEALTYVSDKSVAIGQIVIAPLKDKKVVGIVIGIVTKPSFKVKAVLEITNLSPLPKSLLELLQWICVYYPAPLGVIAQHFVPRNTAERIPDNLEAGPTKELPGLTASQQKALDLMKGPGLHLLHGETGSGKTRVYIELAKKAQQQGKSSLVLSPEISLTSQLANDFYEAFGRQNVVIFHSQLTAVARQKNWLRILRSNEPLVVIGARSALFLPFQDLGLIVVDESHEGAYKQDNAPYYHANTVAAKLANIHQATLVLGSATPSIVDYFMASAKQRPIMYMKETAKKQSSVEIEVIDRREKQQFTKSHYLSDKLLAGIQESLHQKEQSLIFLNRRGTARVVLCENCGWQALCPRCDLPLTYHADSHAIICHSCGIRQPSPSNCPECSNSSILFKSMGTKAVVEQLAKFFPGANIQRFDTDNGKADRLEAHYDRVKAGEIDILVGTQTLAKGLDLPKLAFVGVIDAETSLSFPDFSASERSYQLLSQVLGRIGRGHRAGKAVLQSYSPSSFLIQTAIQKNWHAFYEKELAERKLFNFPPFCFILKIVSRNRSSSVAQKSLQNLGAKLIGSHSNILVEGPAPCFHEKLRGQFQWQLVVKSKSRSVLLDIISGLPANLSYDIDPINLL